MNTTPHLPLPPLLELDASQARRWILVLIILIISANLLEFVTYLVGAAADIIGSLLLGALVIYANWRAGRSVETNLHYYLWRVLPIVALCAVPLYHLLTRESGLDWQDGLLLLRLFLGLICPLAILFYWDHRLRHHLAATTASAE